MTLDEDDAEDRHMKQKYRNQSFLIPRENSFTWSFIIVWVIKILLKQIVKWSIS